MALLILVNRAILPHVAQGFLKSWLRVLTMLRSRSILFSVYAGGNLSFVRASACVWASASAVLNELIILLRGPRSIRQRDLVGPVR